MAEKIWIVREGDGDRVEAIVTRARGDARAIAEGRVFIGRQRARAGDAVRMGDEVRITERRETKIEDVAILFHARGALVVDKPAGIPTIPDAHDAHGSLLHRAARAAKIDPRLLHATSRLDREVSGVVVFTTTDAARASLHHARISGRYFRRYVALSERAPRVNLLQEHEGTWSARIGRARDPKKRMVDGRDATDALTRYRVVATTARAALLSVEPVTGRTHQIRVHAAHAGAPLIGDRDYGGARSIVPASGKVIAVTRIALHCARVRVDDWLDVRAPIPAELRALWRELGGDEALLERD